MSSEEEELDDFEISDYDLAASLGHVKRRKQTKEERILGIWADQPNEPHFQPARKTKKEDYTKSIYNSFVSGGTKAGSKEPDVDADVKFNSSDDDDVLDPNDDTYEKAYLAPKEKKVKVEEKKVEKEDVKVEETNSNIGKSETATGNLKIGGATKAKGGYSMTPTGPKEKADKGFAKFASKGSFAEKMMAKMGWKHGQGLGKFDQGMINPVDVKQRVKGSGLGAHGTERTKQSLVHFPTEEIKKKHEEKEKKKAEKGPQWKNTTKKKKIQYKFTTVDELKESGGYGVASDEDEIVVEEKKPEMKIIDMTGKHGQREIKDMRQIPSQRQQQKSSDHSSSSDDDDDDEEELEKHWDCKELEHNLATLVGHAKNEILRNERSKRDSENKKYNFGYEEKRNNRQIEQDEEYISRLEEVLEIMADEVDTLDEAFIMCKNLKYNFTKEWDEFNLEYEITKDIVLPRLTTLLSRWSPLKTPEAHLDEVTRWKAILPSLYDSLIWEAWMPPVRQSIMRWSPTSDSEEIILFVSLWKSHLAPPIWENVANMLILGKLEQAVQAWNPFKDLVRPDAWLLPWIQVLGEKRLLNCIVSIRQQLRQALTKWTADDRSAVTMLRPWSNVWSPAEWDHFVLQNIVPKLDAYAQTQVVNISSTRTDHFRPLQRWVGLIPQNKMNHIVDKFFAKKWLVALKSWLNYPNTNLADVATFYKAWVKVIDQRLMVSVRDHLNTALQLMSQKCDEKGAPLKPQTVDDDGDAMEIDDSDDDEEEKSYKTRPAAETHDGPPMTFKDLVERRAMQRNLVFLPKGRQFNGKEIYTLGRLNMYIEQGVCFVSDGAGDWVPTSIVKLFVKA